MKFLIVGLGSMGKRRIRNLQYLQAGDIVGIDSRLDRREEAKNSFGITTFAGLDHAMETRPNVMVISTPPDTHMPYARAAAMHRLHFFTEINLVSDGMDEVIELSRGKDFVAAPSCTARFQPMIQFIESTVASGDIGKVLTFSCHSGQYLADWHPWEDYRTFFAAKRNTGACRELMAFELAWLTWLQGPVQAVSCFKAKLTDLEADIDDVYQVLFRFNGGVLGHLMVDAISRVPYKTSRFLGEHGVIECNWSDKEVRVFSKQRESWRTYSPPEEYVEAGYNYGETMYIKEMDHFLRAVRGETPYMYTFAEEKQVLGVIEAAEYSANSGKNVTLPIGDCSHGALATDLHL